MLQEQRKSLCVRVPPPKIYIDGLLGIEKRDTKLAKAERTSWTMIWADKTNPQSPMRLRIVPPTRPDADTIGALVPQKILAAPARHSICQLINHRPVRIGPILAMTTGAIHVADISNATDTVLAIPIWMEL